MNQPHPSAARIERLEERRLLSSVQDDDGAALLNEPPVPDSAPLDGTEIQAHKLAYQRQGPQAEYTVTSNVVGGSGSTGRQPAGALSGKVVFTVGGHGFTAFDNGGGVGGWHTQRGEVSGTEMVEDLGNQDQMTFFVNYAFNAGATVVPLRPVGYQPNEVVLDNDDPQVTYTGAWTNSTSTIFYGSPGDVPYRYASVSASQTATARYTPNISVAGFYPVYTWVKDDTDRINQLYRVAHTGGITDVHVDHSHVGKGYVYLGTYYFNAGTGGYVEISNQGTNSGSSIVVADSIRFGNGMGSIDRGFGVSQQTRSDESALYWIESQRGQGVDDSVFRGTLDTDDNDNVSAPPRWATWMNREVAGTNNEIFLSYHSNASGGRGVLGLFNGNNYPESKTPHQFEWAQLVGKEVNDDMVALSPKLEYAWSNNNSPTLDRSDIEFGEINNLYINDEFDATICEVAYHDNVMDAALMRDPKVRDWVARASVEAAVKYFNAWDPASGNALVQPPESPTNIRSVVQPNGDVTISWAAPAADPIAGAAPTDYTIYTSSDGYGFANPIIVAGGATLTYTIPAAQLNGATYFRVASSNAGGESMPSEVIAAHAGTAARILIVNGFDRIGRTQNPTQTTPLSYDPPFAPGTGNTFERVRPRFSNSFDYAARVADAIKAYSPGQAYDTASNEAVIAGQVSLSNYAAVIWISGEESTADHTFDATEQSLVSSYLNAGGKLFTSGAEIGWDLDAQAHGVSFYNDQLKADYVADDAATYTASGAAGSIFAGISLAFDNGTSGTYDVDFPDKISNIGGSTIAMNYSSPGSGGAAIQYANVNGGRVVNFGFPFETITTTANRNAVMAAILNYFSIPANVGTGSISGRVIRDTDGNGIAGLSEFGLNGWTVFLDADNDTNLDPGETSAVTSGSGDFSFGSVPVGPQNVRVLQQAGWLRTAPAGGVYVVNVTAGSSTTGQNFMQFKTTYTGGSGADQYTLMTDPLNNARVQITEAVFGQGTVNWSIDKSLLAAPSFDGAGDDDTLTIDYTSASPIPTGGVAYAGGTNTLGDQLIITGSASGDTVLAAGATITFGGSISYSGVEKLTANLGGGDDTFTFNAAAAATVFNGGASTTADMLNIVNGLYTFASDASAGTTNLDVTVATGGSALFNSTQHLRNLALNGGVATLSAGGAKVLVARSITVSGVNGKLDLTDNDAVIDYTGSSPLSSITAAIVSGRNDGAWNGPGINTSTAGSSGLTGLGLGETKDVLGLTGSDTALFSGETVDATSILIKYTYVGDANLDGTINADDYASIDFYSTIEGAKGYWNGDFNYDGGINADDYATIDFNVNAQGAPL